MGADALSVLRHNQIKTLAARPCHPRPHPQGCEACRPLGDITINLKRRRRSASPSDRLLALVDEVIESLIVARARGFAAAHELAPARPRQGLAWFFQGAPDSCLAQGIVRSARGQCTPLS